MAAIVGIDAAVLIHLGTPTLAPLWTAGSPGSWTLNGWVALPERNEISLSISVDVAEHKPFVSSLAYAWVDKARTWMNWSGSFSGFYSDTDDSIFTNMKTGSPVWMMLYDSRLTAISAATDYWFGRILLTSVDHTTGSEDFSTLDVDFEGMGPLYRTELVTNFTYG